MSIILLDALDPRQLRESTRELVAVEHTKVSHPQGNAPSTTKVCGQKHETVDEERKGGGGGAGKGGHGCHRKSWQQQPM